jgi:hypothetical protein
MEIFKKKSVKIIGIILGALAIYYIAIIGPEIWKSYQWQKSVDEWQAAQRKPFEEDIYGGKTPEETWAMFLDALKKGDLDLASKYYDVEHQEKERKILLNIKEKNEIGLFLDQLNNPLQKNDTVSDFLKQDRERAYYYYVFKNPISKEQYRNDVNFYLNPSTKVWKILF